MNLKNSKISVDPIRKIEDLKSISKYLSDNPRDLLIWTMGINNGLRASDIVKIKVSDVCDLKINGVHELVETKTGKDNILVINKPTHKALHSYLSKTKPGQDDYLFKSRKGANNHILSRSLGIMIRSWTKALNLKGRYGTHTLRKTWGYQQRVAYGVGFEIICDRYKHSSPATTMRYLGIEKKEIYSILTNEIG